MYNYNITQELVDVLVRVRESQESLSTAISYLDSNNYEYVHYRIELRVVIRVGWRVMFLAVPFSGDKLLTLRLDNLEYALVNTSKGTTVALYEYNGVSLEPYNVDYYRDFAETFTQYKDLTVDSLKEVHYLTPQLTANVVDFVTCAGRMETY